MFRRIRILALILPALLMTAGCAQGPAGVPGGAALVAETPAPLVITGPGDGRAYLRDRAAGVVLLETPLKKGQALEVTLSPARVMVDGAPAAAPPPALSPAGRYELYFKESEPREYHPLRAP